MGKILERDAIIKEMAKDGKTVKEISDVLIERFGTCNGDRLRKRLKKFGFIPISPGSGGQNRRIDYNPFQPLTEEVYYWIGYIMADGSIAKNASTISVNSKDIDHLLLYKEFLERYGGIAGEHRYTNPANSEMITIYFGNQDVKDFLINEFHITPNKSRTIDLINSNKHIIRGIFDGDGTARKEVKITTGSIKMRDSLIKYFTVLGIKSYYRVKDKRHEIPCFDVIVRPESKCLFYQLLYNDATIFLERKRIDLLGHPQVRDWVKNSVNCWKTK